MEAVHRLKLIDRAYSPVMQRLLKAGAGLGLVLYLALLPTLVLSPWLGLRLLWFLFIPVAPMFLLAAPNAWVSLCPISTVQTIARRFGWKKGSRLSRPASSRLQLFGWALMFVGVPSRHLIFNTNGSAVFAVASTLTLLAFVIGLAYFTLSGWCVGACPIRPVEVLYGQFAVDKNRPENCMTCDGCVPSCVRVMPEEGRRELMREPLAGTLAFAFPGFVAAYFLLDITGLCTAERTFLAGARPTLTLGHVGVVYGVMAIGSVLSYAVFRATHLLLGVPRRTLFKAAAIAAYSFYYIGVVPEIVEAWSLSSTWVWALLFVPFAVLGFALWAHSRAKLSITPLRAGG